MFNAQRPNLDDLPTNRQLIRATLIAAASAGALGLALLRGLVRGADLRLEALAELAIVQ